MAILSTQFCIGPLGIYHDFIPSLHMMFLLEFKSFWFSSGLRYFLIMNLHKASVATKKPEINSMHANSWVFQDHTLLLTAGAMLNAHEIVYGFKTYYNIYTSRNFSWSLNTVFWSCALFILLLNCLVLSCSNCSHDHIEFKLVH